MNYIEELANGETFSYKEDKFILTADFKKNGSRLCTNLVDGSQRWFESSDIIDKTPVYYIDNDNNIVNLKKDTTNEKNINIS